jgi:DNA-binding NtrC family response regulator
VQEKQFERIGENHTRQADVRVLAATNRDLPAMVRQGLFREDLFYRLSTIAVVLPPLRERREDIALLARYLVGRLNERFGFQKRIAETTLRVLRDHDWPGNVRELSHAIEAAMVVCDGPDILPEHLPGPLREARPKPGRDSLAAGAEAALPTLQDLERSHIEAALKATGGHRGETARLLGISERNLYRKLKEHGLVA